MQRALSRNQQVFRTTLRWMCLKPIPGTTKMAEIELLYRRRGVCAGPEPCRLEY